MTTPRNLLTAACCLLAVVVTHLPPSYGADYTGGGFDPTDWTDPDNWGGVGPTDDTANINGPFTVIVADDQVNSLRLGSGAEVTVPAGVTLSSVVAESGGPGWFNDGGTATVSVLNIEGVYDFSANAGNFWMGDNFDAAWEMNVSGNGVVSTAGEMLNARSGGGVNISDNASVDVAFRFMFGYYDFGAGPAGLDVAFSMTGGTVNVGDTFGFGPTSNVTSATMSGGTLTAGGFSFSPDAAGTFDFTGGEIILDGDQTGIIDEPWFNGPTANAVFDGTTTVISTATPVLATIYDWKADRSGDFNASSNWSPVDGNTNDLPFDNTHSVIFGSAIQSDQTVYTNTTTTVKSIEFDNANSYAIMGLGSVDLEADTGNATMNVVQGSHQFQVAVNLNSNTDLNVEGGAALAFNNTLDLNGNVLAQTGTGSVAFNNAVIGGTVALAAGSATGSGMIDGDLLNERGSFSPGDGIGSFVITGDYIQEIDALLSIEIDGVEAGVEHDVLTVGQTAHLAGGLELILMNGFEPEVGDQFAILDAGTIVGSFDELILPSLDGDLTWELGFSDNRGGLLVSVVPEPNSIMLLGFGLAAWAVVRIRQRGSAVLMRALLLITLGTVIFSASTADAQINIWCGFGCFDDDWGNPFNWDLGTVPVDPEHAIVDGDLDPFIAGAAGVTGATGTMGQLTLANAATLNIGSGVVMETISGGSNLIGDGPLNLLSTMNISGTGQFLQQNGNNTWVGDSVDGPGALNVSGDGLFQMEGELIASVRSDGTITLADNGTIDVGARVLFGLIGNTLNGTFDMGGGTLRASQFGVLGGITMTASMTGGLMDVGSLSWEADAGTFDFFGGEILVDGDQTGTIPGQPWFNTPAGQVPNAVFDGSRTSITLVAAPDSTEWLPDDSGDWHVASNWGFGIIPNADNLSAILGGAISSPQSVYTNSAVTIKGLLIDNANSYGVGGNGSLTLQADTGNASISVVQGSHQLQLPVSLGSNTDVNVASGAKLTLQHELDLAGRTLTKSGSGELAVNSQLAAGAGTVDVTAGTLSGVGRIGGDVNSGATVSPGLSFGTLAVDGNYTQSASATLEIEIGGLAPDIEFDVLSVGGTADLSGNLNIDLVGFTPGSGDFFDVVTATSVSESGLTLTGDSNGFSFSILGGNTLRLLFEGGLTCDLDGDGDCDIDDLDDFYDEIAAGTSTNDDISDWLSAAGTENGKVYLPGDTDLDGNVAGNDFTQLALDFGKEGLPNAYWGNGNFDGNFGGTFLVGGPDFTGLALNFGHTSVSAVPEPTGLVVLMCGSFALCGLTRRCRFKH